MVLEPDALEWPHAFLAAGELRQRGVTGAFVGLLPDEEDLVDRAQRVDLELVVGVLARDEHLDVVVLVDE